MGACCSPLTTLAACCLPPVDRVDADTPSRRLSRCTPDHRLHHSACAPSSFVPALSHTHAPRHSQAYDLRDRDTGTKINCSVQVRVWMKRPPVRGMPAEPVELPRNWYLDDLPPMLQVSALCRARHGCSDEPRASFFKSSPDSHSLASVDRASRSLFPRPAGLLRARLYARPIARCGRGHIPSLPSQYCVQAAGLRSLDAHAPAARLSARVRISDSQRPPNSELVRPRLHPPAAFSSQVGLQPAAHTHSHPHHACPSLLARGISLASGHQPLSPASCTADPLRAKSLITHTPHPHATDVRTPAVFRRSRSHRASRNTRALRARRPRLPYPSATHPPTAERGRGCSREKDSRFSIFGAQHGVRALPARAMTAGPGSSCPNVHARPREAGAHQQSSFACVPGRERDYGTAQCARQRTRILHVARARCEACAATASSTIGPDQTCIPAWRRADGRTA
ncbi:hypothetical protein POSPLADRAFT_1063052 [Postia placenta MAD-698-R-SB12]|uniref:Uncharacterized protein n=1 Tax=Postia placenta MAD-698-R-SB12 TaxID=670580 RepID=A0A1X6MIP9_9APHY|nr:hypothetical protein POSPLADRAFT_1063052 [Postia placenta MAD-698-R-SB12]OSX56042.1 hypothetical protein POSPLADRAFT_1063052 [Postia placenta MAD-698-R-SB12]